MTNGLARQTARLRWRLCCSCSDSLLARNSALPLEQIGAAILVHFGTRIESMRVLLAPVLDTGDEQTSKRSRRVSCRPRGRMRRARPPSAVRLSVRLTLRSDARRALAMPVPTAPTFTASSVKREHEHASDDSAEAVSGGGGAVLCLRVVPRPASRLRPSSLIALSLCSARMYARIHSLACTSPRLNHGSTDLQT
jgi:hypothetical protein